MLQTKKWLSNTVLFAFILLVGGATFLSHLLKTPVKSHNEFIEQSLVFNNKELESITRLSLKNKSGEYIFERVDTGVSTPWHMVSPKDTSTSSLFIEKLFASLNVIKTKKLLIDDQANNSNFSLDRPTATLTLTDDAQKSIILNVGIMNTIDNSTYLKISGKSGIYHVEAPSVSLENITLSDLIESTVFTIDLKQIASFKIFKKGVSSPQFEVAKKGNTWVNAEGKNLDSPRLEDMLDEFIKLKSSHVLEELSDQQKKATQKLLSPPDFVVKIETIDGEQKEEFIYQVSALTKSLPDVDLKDEAHFLISENHAPIVYVIKKEALALFDLKNDALKPLESLTAPSTPAN